MDKRGQFFLIAALVIVTLLFSIGAVYNYATVQKEETQIYDLSKELGYEGASVIDSGVYNSQQGETPSYLMGLIGNYSASSPDSDFLAVYGNSGNLLLFNASNKCTGSASLGSTGLSICTRNLRNSTLPMGNPVVITLGGIEYKFDLQAGQNFYIVIKKERNGEIYIAKT
jgi:hypothetical protein